MIINSRGKTQKDRKTKRIGDSAPRSPFAASRPSLLKSEATHFGLIRSDLVGFTRINPTDGTTLRRLPPNPSNRACPPLLHSLRLQIPTESIRFTLIYFDLVGFGWICPAQSSVLESLQGGSPPPGIPGPTSHPGHQSPRKRFDLVGFSRIGPAICDSGALFQTSGVRRLSGFPIRARQRHRTWLISKNGILVATDR